MVVTIAIVADSEPLRHDEAADSSLLFKEIKIRIKINFNNMQEIRKLIGRGKPDKAIEELLKLNTSHNDLIISVQGQLSDLKNKEILNIISNTDATLEKNGINYSLLKIASTIEAELTSHVPPIDVSDTIDASENENLEKIIGRNGLSRIGWLEIGVEKAKCICKIRAGDSYGTGFLVEGGYIYTNNHVIGSASIAQYTSIEFGYDNHHTPSVSYKLDHSDFVTSKELDYTKVKVIDKDTHSLSSWGYLEISSEQPNPNDALIIIQHPKGRQKEIAFSDNQNSIWEHRLHYKVTTEPGSSGSPVFDMNWKVVALHHAGGNIKINAQGTTKFVNEGILFKHIQADIANQETTVDNASTPAPSYSRKTQQYSKPIKTMFVYHLLDRSYVDELKSHLFFHIRNENIDILDVQNVPPQGNKAAFLDKGFEEAELIFVFISSHLYKKETRDMALQAEKAVGEKIVIPIKISPFKLKGTSFDKLVGLPRDKSIIAHENIDAILYAIVESISEVIENMLG